MGRRSEPTPPLPDSANRAQGDEQGGSDGSEYTSLAEFTPYFTHVAGGAAATALAEDRLTEALPLFEDIAETTSDIVLTPRARFLAGYIAERLGDDRKALDLLYESGDAIPEIADLAYERAARAALRLGDCARAVSLADRVSKESAYAADAALTRADALRFLGKHLEAVDAYNSYLKGWPSGYRHQEAKSRIVSAAAALIKSGELDDATAEAAYRMLEELQASHPRGYWTRQAEDHEALLCARLGRAPPDEPRARRAVLEALEKAESLKQRMRNEEAEKAFARVIRLAKNPKLKCSARLDQAIVVQRQRDFGRAAALYDDIAADCADPNTRIRALFRGAKAFEAAGERDSAVRLYAEVERQFPHHSYADDARLRGARVELERGNRALFEEMLRSLPDMYPDGDMRAEALWSLCFDALERNDLAAAEQASAKYFELFPNETGWYAAGRSGYWHARIKERLGDHTSARAYYEQVIASAPLSFYMVLAYNRLAALDKLRAEALMAALAPKGGFADMKLERALVRQYRPLAVGIELHRLGLVSCAKREFEALLERADLPAEVYWIVAAFQRRAGDYANAKETAVKEAGWKQRYPANRDLLPWTLAYPTVFESIVGEAAEAHLVPPHLIWAIMREESGFNTKIESWANAMGLMQLILPTAKSMGRELGIQVNRRQLKRPEVNIPLGTAYLAYLDRCFGGHPVLTIAGYNAGEGAVGRWLARGFSRDVDLFVEQIPYDQTRGYTKRVISTYATYAFLYGDEREVLPLPLQFPD